MITLAVEFNLVGEPLSCARTVRSNSAKASRSKNSEGLRWITPLESVPIT